MEGRTEILKINYRTSHQIRTQADILLGKEIADVDGVKESRQEAISVFNGPAPEIIECGSEEEEAEIVAQWIKDRVGDGIEIGEIGVCVRSTDQIERAKKALDKSGFEYRDLTVDKNESGGISVVTMHRAKGLEFRAMAVTSCDDDVIPLQERIELAADESDLEEVYNTERHLLYVACTRARDHLLITGAKPISEFVEDLGR